MKLTSGIIIFLLSLVAMPATVLISMIFSASEGGSQGVSSFFGWLMLMVGIVGGSALLGGIIGSISKNEKTGLKAFAICALIIGGGYTALRILLRVV